MTSTPGPLLCADLFHTFSGNHEHAHRMAKLRRAQKFLIDDTHHESVASLCEETDAAEATLYEAYSAGRHIDLPFPEILIEWRVPSFANTQLVYAAWDAAAERFVLEVYVYAQQKRRPPVWVFKGEYDASSHYAIVVDKLLVLLDADMTVRERVLAANLKRNWNGSPRTKPCDYTVLRPPVEYAGAPAGAAPGTGTPRRMHLVRGFQWGRHTRPVEEQRWIKPHWRGDAGRGVVRRDHYRVAGTGR